MATFAILFLLLSTRYQHDAPMVEYGREDGQSWMLWKARSLDEAALRDHPGGKVAWFIGNSVMRDSFQQVPLNKALAAADSPWRVAKFAVARGAPGLSAGMLDELPIRAGDRIVSSVAIDNFYRDWLHEVDFPSDRLARMLSPAEILSIAEFSRQERLEYALGVPYNFYRHQEPYMAGQASWFTALWWMAPPDRERPGQAFNARKTTTVGWLDRRRDNSWSNFERITPERLDWSADQFHISGVAQLRAFAASNAVSLSLVDIPPRQELQVALVDPAARAEWLAWLAAQPEVSHFPQLDEDQYYDLRHPNPAGRAVLTDYILEWIAYTPRGEPSALTWTPETP